MRILSAILLCIVGSEIGWAADATPSRPNEGALSMVVMDPLAAPLSCPCVAGYAQRDYEKLAAYLSERLGRPVHVTFAESFDKALAKEGCAAIDMAIGKDSVVRHDAAAKKIKVTPVGQLTGKDGQATQTGLIVVRSADTAQSISELRGYRILFGTPECDEKFAAARSLLTKSGIELTSIESAETTAQCTDGACKIIEWGDSEHAAAVISSYAAPLLEGCGTIKKGDLRVIGQTEPVPFITAFVSERVDRQLRRQIRAELLAVGEHQDLKEALETAAGFLPIDENYRALRKQIRASAEPERRAEAGTKPTGTLRKGKEKAASAWPGWRGPNRDGRVAWLPKTLTKEPTIVWRQPLARAGLGGIAATADVVLLGDRDISNTCDEFRCYAAADGTLRWSLRYSAPGKLDYDNTPRATPLVYEGCAYFLGAFGDLTCVDLETGLLMWQKNLIREFDGEPELVWGLCSSPLVVDKKLIVGPGGPQASIVALDPITGEVIWKSAGERHAYASFIVGAFGGVRQLVGYDEKSLGGWDIDTGCRLWTLKPPHKGDFNVPTPVAHVGQLLVSTENNGTRLYSFDARGSINPRPTATYDRLAPETSTPVIVKNRAFCVAVEMYCLDLADGLKPVWIGEDKAFRHHSPLLASEDRVLAVGAGGELILVDATADAFRIISRLDVFGETDNRTEILAHPALVGTRLYLRGEHELVCVDLTPAAKGR